MSIKDFLTAGLGWIVDGLNSQLRYRQVLGNGFARFHAEIIEENYLRTGIASIALAVWHIVILILNIPHWTDGSVPMNYFVPVNLIGASVIGIGVLTLLVRGLIKANRWLTPGIRTLATWFFILWIGTTSIVFEVMTQGMVNSIVFYPYQLALFTFAFGLSLTPGQSLGLYGVMAFCAVAGVSLIQPVHLLSDMGNNNILLVTACTYVLSRLIFAARIREFLRVRTIERQALEIRESRRENDTLKFAIQFGLSPREREILPLLVEGLSNQAIADKVFVSLDTIKKHVYHIYRKTDVENRLTLVRKIEATSGRPDHAQSPS